MGFHAFLKGQKSKGGTANDAENTIRSRSRARFIEIISEGEIEGLVNGDRSIYFDQTPIKNTNLSVNFENVIWEEHKGTADDGYFQGHDSVGTGFAVGVPVTLDGGPIARTIVEPDADAVMVIVQVDSLFVMNADDGSLGVNTVKYKIETRTAGGSWIERIRQEVVQEKCMSPVQFSHRIPLELDGGPWDVRVARISPDETDEKSQSGISFAGYTVLVEGKYTYPHSAAVAIEVNAEDFAGQIPSRSYHVKGRKIQVPTNYDPVTKTYSGVWNGTFKTAYSNCPPWVLYDLLTNTRFGIGEFIPTASINKWALYAIGQYSDQKVPTGLKDVNGDPILQHRYEFNGVINDRKEAFQAIQDMTTTFRGMAYWSLGQVYAVADMPSDPVKLVTPANVLGGTFEYSSTAVKARHSVVLVRWNNPDDFYRPDTELVVNEALLQKYGWREKSLQLSGCTNRSLAQRYGRWALDVEQHENETVTYSASFDHIDVVPGDIIAVADPRRANVRAGGRLYSDSSSNDFILDSEFTMTPGETYFIYVTLPDMSVEKLPIQSIVNGYAVTTSNSISAGIALKDSVYVITGTDVAPRQYRVLAVSETEPNIFQVTALSHDPLKYARIDYGVILEPIDYTRQPDTLPKPTNLIAVELSKLEFGRMKTEVTLSWTPPLNTLVRHFSVSMDTPSQKNKSIGNATSNAIEFPVDETGVHTFYVKAVDYVGRESEAATLVTNVSGGLNLTSSNVTDLALAEGGTQFYGNDVRIKWNNNFASSSAVGATNSTLTNRPSPVFSHNEVEVRIAGTATVLRIARVTDTNYTYDYLSNQADSLAQGISDPQRNLTFLVRTVDTRGGASLQAEATFTNPQPVVSGINVGVSINTVTVNWTPITEPDHRGTLVWIETLSGFAAGNYTPKFDGAGGQFTWEGLPNTTYFVRIAAYDSFSKVGYVPSAQYSVTTGGGPVVLDLAPPGVPTNLTVTSVRDNDETWLVVDWDASTGAPVYYDIGLTQEGSNETTISTPDTEASGRVTPGLEYKVRVRGVDRLGNFSAYTAQVTHVAIGDTIPPAIPHTPIVNVGFGTVWLKWEPNTEPDLRHYELFEQASITPAPTLATPETYAFVSNQFVRPGLSNAQTLYYWLRAVDTSGNRSEWTPAVAATTPASAGVVQSDLDGLIDATSFAAGLEPVTVVTGALPAARQTDVITFNGELYRWNGSAYAKSIPTVDLVGDIVAAQIADGAINTAKFAAGLKPIEVVGTLPGAPHVEGRMVFLTTDDKLYRNTGSGWISSVPSTDISGQLAAAQIAALEASKITGTLTNAQIADLAATKLTGQIATVQIADGALTTAKFASSLKPVEIVGALPGAPHVEGRMVFLTTDDKLYRNTGTGWVSSVAATDISGQVQAAQIAALEASKITGTLTNAQIADLAAAKLTGQITAVQITDNAITAPKIAAGTITGDKLVANTITATQIATSTITATQIAAATITGAKIAAGTITGGNIAADTITAGQIAANAITASELSANSVIAGKIAAGVITATEIATNAITAIKIAAGTITGDKLVAGTITAVNIAAATITGDKLVANTITATQIAASTITAAQIAAGTITGAKIAAGTIDASHIVSNSITAGQIAANAITSSELSANSVIAGKIAAGVITATEIATNAITAVKIAAGTITGDKLVAGTITATQIATDTITAAQIATNAITANELAANSVTTAAITAGAVKADQVDAGAITAAKLAIGDFTNYASGSDFASAALNPWDFTGRSEFIIEAFNSPGNSASGRLKIIALGGATSVPLLRQISVLPGEVIYVSFWAYRDSGYNGTTTNAKLRFGNASAAGAEIYSVLYSTANFPLTTWTKIEDRFTVPSGASSLTVSLGRDHTAGTLYLDEIEIRKQLKGELIVDGTIQANHLSTNTLITNTAQIGDGTITNAKITDLSAAKLTASTALAGSITVSGTALSTVTSNALNPAAVVNAAATLIDPGKILISGGTSLDDWRMGGDLTKINGGNISANTISANKLEIGSRNVTLTGIQFEHNSPTTNKVSWTAGTVAYINDAGASTSKSITASNATWSSGVLYIYWVKDATTLSATTTQSTALGANNVILATYQGGTLLDVDYGRTIIDGSSIKTNTITATQIAAYTITATQIDSGTITSAQIATDTITATNLIKTENLITSNAQMGNAVVDTLTIAGQAVTVASSLFIPDKFLIKETATWETLAQIYQVREAGFSTVFNCSFSLNGLGTGVIVVAIWRGNTVIAEYRNATAEGGAQTAVSFTGEDSDRGSSSEIYAVTFRRIDPGSSGGRDAEMNVQRLFFQTQQVKR